MLEEIGAILERSHEAALAIRHLERPAMEECLPTGEQAREKRCPFTARKIDERCDEARRKLERHARARPRGLRRTRAISQELERRRDSLELLAPERSPGISLGA